MTNKIGLPLKFDYRMMALIRELVSNERYRIWTEDKMPNMKRGSTSAQFKEAYEKIIEECRNPWIRQGLCNLILDEINDMEEQLKIAMSPDSIHCPECDKLVYITISEPPRNKDFMHLPRWRELSCNHAVDIQGRLLSSEKLQQFKNELVRRNE